MTTSLNVGSEQLAPDQTAVQVQPAVVPAVFQPHVPLFKHVGLHTARMVQLAPDQAAVHVQTDAVSAVFQSVARPAVGARRAAVERSAQFARNRFVEAKIELSDNNFNTIIILPSGRIHVSSVHTQHPMQQAA